MTSKHILNLQIASIRARMTLAFSLALTLLLAIVCAGLIFYAVHDAKRTAESTLDTAAQKVRDELSDTDPKKSLEAFLEEKRDLATENLTLTLIDSNSKVIEQSGKRVPEFPHTRDDGWLIQTVPSGNRTIVIGLYWRRTEKVLRKQAVVLVSLSGIILVCASVGAWVLVGRTLSPIERLTRQAQVASVQSLRVHLDAPSQDAEIVGLVATLNGLLERLGESAATRGRFYAAASHELRTPLQALSGHLELSLTRPRSLEEYRATVEEANAQTGRLTSLVRDLLLLNQLDSGSLPPQENVDLADLCARKLQHFAPVCVAKELSIHFEIPVEVFLLTADTHIEMLVRNLLENAIKYADRGGELRLGLISSTTQTDRTVLRIYNTFTLEDRQQWDARKLFEPFYRPDASRNSETGGNGLGLAICKAIADANGWKISLIHDGKGVLATVVFA